MKGKSALFALAVVLLMGTMGGVALAGNYDMNVFEPADSSVSAQPEQGVEQSEAGEIREPMETGAVPDRPGSSYDLDWGAIGDEPTMESGGQPYSPDVDPGT